MKIWPTLKRKLYILFPESAPLLKWVLGGQIVLFPLWVNWYVSETSFYHGTRMQEFFSHFRTFIDYF